MLGLGSSIVHGSPGGYVLIDTYTSDFTDGAGDDSSTWSDYSIEGGSLTFATNSDITDADGTTGDWLKATFPNAVQTAASGIDGTLDGRIWEAGDMLEWSCKFYLDGDWEDSDNVTIAIYMGAYSYSSNKIITATPSAGLFNGGTQFGQFYFRQDINKIVELTGRLDIIRNVSSSMKFLATATADEPQDNTAFMAIKDLEIKTYRRFG